MPQFQSNESDPSKWRPSDRVEIRGLRLHLKCGVSEEERSVLQYIEIDLDMFIELDQAGETDDLQKTVDYGLVCELLDSKLPSTEFLLLESIARETAEIVFSDTPADDVTVTVRKLKVPVLQVVSSASVTIHRLRSDY